MDEELIPTHMPTQDKVVVTTAIFIGITSMVLLLRVISRPLCKVDFSPEDFLVFFAVLMFWATCGVEIAAAHLGEQIPYYNDPRYSAYSHLMFVSNVLYIPTITLVNISILWLYRRLFTVSKTRPYITGLIVIQILWFITSLFGYIFSCKPVPDYWEVDMIGTCMNFGYFWLAMGVFETIIDVAIFVLPFFELVKLKINWTKKALLLVLFGIGGVSVVTQICRVIYSYGGPIDILDTIWIYVHAGTAILCACLPQLRPLLAFIPWYKYTNISRSAGNSGDSGRRKKDSDPSNPERGPSHLAMAKLDQAAGSKENRWSNIDHSIDAKNLLTISKASTMDEHWIELEHAESGNARRDSGSCV